MAESQQTFHILPYTSIVGQEPLKRALEFAYIAPGLGGVLISGERGTAKSTAVRAFARMMYETLPVTLPINATEDRVVGGWRIESLLRGQPEPQPGLLEEANGKLLYVDEVNLLDDHIVNMILDVASTGVLDIQREGFSRNKQTRFTLVGTMNPEEGILRPQLLDRFGLVVSVTAEASRERRLEILKTVLAHDRTRLSSDQGRTKALARQRAADDKKRGQLEAARALVQRVKFDDTALDRCIAIVQKVKAQGHRGEQAMALAAKAHVASELASNVDRRPIVSPADVDKVAVLAIRHRRPKGAGGDAMLWTDADNRDLFGSIATS